MISSHNQLHMYGFSDVVKLLGSAPGTMYGALGYESVKHVIIKQIKDVYKQAEMAWLLQLVHFISHNS